MRIGLVFHSTFPWNRGIFLVASALHSDGHDVVILCKRGEKDKESEKVDYATILRFPYDTQIPILNRLISSHWGVNPFWVKWILQISRRYSLNLLWVRELPLIPSALLAGRILKIPVSFDMRENYPAALEISERRNLLHHVVHNRKLVQILEDYAVRFANHVFVVIDEQKERLIERGVPSGKVTINITTPDNAFIPPLAERPPRNLENPLRIVYSGFLLGFRGIEFTVNAMALARQLGVKVELTIAGGGYNGDSGIESSIRKRAARLDLIKSIHFAGWLAPQELPRFLQSFDVGLIANEISDHTNTTIPGKLFEYMAAGLPVASSGLGPVKRILEENRCGMVFQPYKPERLADVFVRLCTGSPEEMRKMGRRGYEAVKKRYNWRIQSKSLTEVVRGYETHSNRTYAAGQYDHQRRLPDL